MTWNVPGGSVSQMVSKLDRLTPTAGERQRHLHPSTRPRAGIPSPFSIAFIKFAEPEPDDKITEAPEVVEVDCICQPEVNSCISSRSILLSKLTTQNWSAPSNLASLEWKIFSSNHLWLNAILSLADGIRISLNSPSKVLNFRHKVSPGLCEEKREIWK